VTTPGPVSRAEVRQRIAAAITGALGATWRESAYAYDVLGADGQSVAHLSFAVGVGRSVPTRLDRQRPDVGSMAATPVFVRFLHRVRGDAQVKDYDAALDAGEQLRTAVLAVDRDPGIAVLWTEDGQPVPVGDGTFLRMQFGFTVHHRTALE
jgi:hypothetical protein